MIKKLYNLEIVRFIITGGINTLMGGILIPLLARYLMNGNPSFYGIDISLLIGYLIWFSFAYLLQIKFVFNSNFELKRYLIYPLTQIPNYLLNNLFLYLFETLLNINSIISFVLASLLSVPIMFILVRLVVKNKKEE